MSSDFFIDRPGIDTAEILADGKVFPVVLTIPFDTKLNTNIPTAGSWEPPPHNIIVLTEDSNNKLVGVEYLMGETTVDSLEFSYSDYSFVTPYKTTTISRGA